MRFSLLKRTLYGLILASTLFFTTLEGISVFPALLSLDLKNNPILKEQLIQLQPAWYGAFDWSTENSLTNAQQVITNNLLARVREYRCSSICDCVGYVPFRNIWVAALGGHLQQNKLQQLPAFRTNDYGALAGCDFVLADWLTVGIAGGYTHSNLKWDHLTGLNRISNFYVGPYAAWSCGCWGLEASFLKGFQTYHSNRHIQFKGIHRQAKGTNYAGSYLAHLGGTLNYCWGVFDFQPYVSADYVYLHIHGFKEKKALDLDLHVKRRCAEFFQGEVGAQFSATIKSNCAVVVPTVKAGFQNITPFNHSKIKSTIAGALLHQHFTVETTHRTIYQWTTGLFLNIHFMNCVEFSLSYNGAFGPKRRQYYYTGEVDWSF